MNRLIKRLQGGQKGFTLIELLVVIAILGVISAVVALNIAGFFGRGTLEAANTELHQAQTAIIAMMADAQSNRVVVEGGTWAGDDGTVTIVSGGVTYDAANYVYGPFRAAYAVVAWAPNVTNPGAIVDGFASGDNAPDNPWGDSIEWNEALANWRRAGTGG